MPKVKPEHRTHLQPYAEVSAEAVGDANSCTVVALALVTGSSFKLAQETMAQHGREVGHAVHQSKLLEAAQALGFKCEEVVAQDIIDTFPKPHFNLKSLTMHHPERFKAQWPDGRYFAFTKGHVAAVVDKEVHDHSRGATSRITRLVRVYKEDATSAETSE